MFYYAATDLAGNTTNTSISINLDRTAPDLSVALNTTTRSSISVSCTDSGGSGLASNINQTISLSGKSSPYTVDKTCKDNAGNSKHVKKVYENSAHSVCGSYTCNCVNTTCKSYSDWSGWVNYSCYGYDTSTKTNGCTVSKPADSSTDKWRCAKIDGCSASHKTMLQHKSRSCTAYNQSCSTCYNTCWHKTSG